jgi:hypothetical protein
MHDRELRTAIDMPAKYPDLRRARGAELRAYAGMRRRAPALALVDTLLREASDPSGSFLARVGTAAREFRAHGDIATATALLEKAREWIAMHPVGAPTVPRQFFEGLIFLSSGAADSAVVRFASVAPKMPGFQSVGLLAVAQAMAGDRVRAQAAADSLGALSHGRLFGDQIFWQAAIEAALGDRATAVQLLQRARDSARSAEASDGASMRLWHYHVALDNLRGYPPFEALIRPKR